MAIIVYNRTQEDHSSSKFNFYIGRGSPVGNPFTHKSLGYTKAEFQLPTREKAIEAYEMYFDAMYGTDENFTKYIDLIYAAYKTGEDVYLECYCKPKACHGDVIVDKLRCRLIKEKLKK